MNCFDWSSVEALSQALLCCHQQGNRVFICGNGGSAANAVHIANDLLYGSVPQGRGIKAVALSTNIAVITCVANDIDYADVFSYQLATHGEAGDLLIALSGSGNSENIIRTIQQASSMDIHSFAILGYSGGCCKELADTPIHFPVNDMQIAEDLQLIVGHMVMQYLCNRTSLDEESKA